MSATQLRQPRGSSVGGQFAPDRRAEADLGGDLLCQHCLSDCAADPCLASVAARWSAGDGTGETPRVDVGSRTPWGTAQSVATDTGAVFVSTASHGGVKLSPERNRSIAPAFRQPSGWYDEDDGYAIVAAFHPDLTRWQEHEVKRFLKDYYPDEYEATFGVTVSPDESKTLRDRLARESLARLRAERAHQMVAIRLAHHDIVPPGTVLVECERSSDGATAIMLAPSGSIDVSTVPVVEGSNLVDVTDIVTEYRSAVAPPDPPSVGAIEVDLSRLAPSDQERAQEFLQRRYRYEDGAVRTFLDGLTHDGVHSRRRVYDSGSGRTSYALSTRRGSYPVPKPVYDAVSNLPDMTPEDFAAKREVALARAAVSRQHRGAQERERALDRLTAARIAAQAHDDRERERYRLLREQSSTRIAERLAQAQP